MAEPETSASRPKLLLVDGHGLAFRAYHALPEMINPRGEPVRVAFGYTSMLLMALSQGFDCAVAAFDPPGPTFRDRLLETYKGQRQPAPEELVAQVPVCQRLTEALNIPVVVVAGYEADDVLGTLSRQAREAGCLTHILTGDMDLLQLVDDTTLVQTSRRGSTEPVIYDPGAVRERYGFDPARMIDFKALRGDSSDNIPGVPGIGEKTATQLIQTYGDLDAVLAAVPSMPPGRVRNNLESHLDEARQGLQLVTIGREVPGVELDLDSCRTSGYDREEAAALLRELGLPSLVARLPGNAAVVPSPAQAESRASQVVVLQDGEQLRAAVETIRATGQPLALMAAFDEPARKGQVSGLGLALAGGPAWYAPLGDGNAEGISSTDLEPLQDLLRDPGLAKSAYQLKDELLALGGAGWELAGEDMDCVLASYLTDSRGRTLSLAALCQELDQPRPPDPDDYLGKGSARVQPSGLGPERAAELFGGQAACVAAIREPLAARLEEAQGTALLRDLELPVTAVLAGMEARGVRVDGEQLRSISKEIQTQVGKLEEEMFGIAGHIFLPGSSPQLGALLYDELGLKSSRRTKTGRSTDAQALEGLREEHPIVPLVLEWRQLTKLKSTYVDALPELVDPADGRIHTSFNQAVAATGRLSSSDPNLQNIPVRTELGRRIRAAFVPGEPDWALLSADYSQIELRVLAHLSQDPELLASFSRGDDIHRETAARVFSVDREAVTADQRRMAKVVNFGILYGLSGFGLARDLGIPAATADEFIKRYFATFAGVREYLQSVREEAHKQGYVTTLMGRRRHLGEINSGNRQVREASERMAINMPIQGSAADLMKLGMIRTAAALAKAGCQAWMLLQVHDELVFEAPREELQQVGRIAMEGMSQVANLGVPLGVELKSGPNWRDLTPFRLQAA